MKKEQFQNIKKCIKQRGTITQRRDFRSFENCVAWEIAYFEKEKLYYQARDTQKTCEANEELWLKEKDKKIYFQNRLLILEEYLTKIGKISEKIYKKKEFKI